MDWDFFCVGLSFSICEEGHKGSLSNDHSRPRKETDKNSNMRYADSCIIPSSSYNERS